MTDKEIRCAALKYGYDANKVGKVAMVVKSRMITNYNLDKKKVSSIFRSLEKEGLLKTATGGRWVWIGRYEVTEKGIREYEEKCQKN